ncbi:MAG: hypothetical protein QMD04_04130 [Anaerolineales bacterium]|nr:hypothetical protein [Anaerolineales bacterium]
MGKQLRLKRWHLWVVVILPILGIIYLAWCYGLWGRNNLFLQYLFQCCCPLHSESFRYPEQAEVIIPACHKQDKFITISSGGALIQVGSPYNFKYILDLRTGKRIKLPTTREDDYEILSDDLLFYQTSQREAFVFDIHTRMSYPVEYLKNLPFLVDEWGQRTTIDPTVIIPILRSAHEVFVVGRYDVVFNTDSRYYGISTSDLIICCSLSIEEFLNTHQISYVSPKNIFDFTGELSSRSGTFLARADGIYLTNTNERIVKNYQLPNSDYLEPIAWRYDDRGVILSSWGFGAYGLDFSGFLPTFLPAHFFPVPQPVLILKVPPEYLPPAP